MLPSNYQQRQPVYEIDPRLDAAIELGIPLDPRICGPPEQRPGLLQMPLDEQGLSDHTINRRCWETMGFLDSHNISAAMSSMD